MNLDLAIQNQVIGRSFMADAMHGVASNLGDGHYRLNSFYESENEANFYSWQKELVNLCS